MSTILAPNPDPTQRDHPLRARATRAVTPLDQLLAEQHYTVAKLIELRTQIGHELHAARVARRLTAKKAAHLAGVRPTEVGQIEHYEQFRKVNWRDDVADRLAQAYARFPVHPLEQDGNNV